MAFNSIVVICNREETLNKISKRLVLLRGQDSISYFPLTMALEQLKSKLPNIIIVPIEDSEEEAFNSLKQIKKDDIFKNIPVIMLAKEKTREFFTKAYELGADEILFDEIPDYELLIRIIWLMKKSESTRNSEKFDIFLKSIGVFDNNSELLNEEYGERFLLSEIKHSKDFDIASSLMLVYSPDGNKEFIHIVKNTIRNLDAVIKDGDKYFILMPETDIKGAKKLFERLSSLLRLEGGIRGVVSDIKKFEFDEIKEKMYETLEKVEENILVVLSKNSLKPVALTSKEIEEKSINKFKKIKNLRKSKKLDKDAQEIVPESKDDIEKDIEITNQNIKKIKKNANLSLASTEEIIKSLENKIQQSIQTNEVVPTEEIIKRNTRLYKLKEVAKAKKKDTLFEQTFQKKIKLIILPQLSKYKEWAELHIKKAIVDIIVESDKCTFILYKGEISYILEMKLEGKDVLIDIKEIILNKTKKNKHTKVEVLEFSSEKMAKLMAIYTKEVEKSVKND